MDLLLPQAYLIGLIVLLGGAAVVIGLQVWRVRADEVRLAKLEIKVKEGTVEKTGEATDQLLADSRVVVPYQEGDLSRSGWAHTRDTGAGAEGIVHYDIVYARNHELSENFQHQDQGQAHGAGRVLPATVLTLPDRAAM